MPAAHSPSGPSLSSSLRLLVGIVSAKASGVAVTNFPAPGRDSGPSERVTRKFEMPGWGHVAGKKGVR